MKLFLWFLIVVIALETVGRLLWLVKDSVLPTRTKKEVAVDLFFGAVVIAWAAYLLGNAA